ncbi:hypothetical protein T439DRAFT_336969 [Meredithblackwellia eburnea MCA 4105]
MSLNIRSNRSRGGEGGQGPDPSDGWSTGYPSSTVVSANPVPHSSYGDSRAPSSAQTVFNSSRGLVRHEHYYEYDNRIVPYHGQPPSSPFYSTTSSEVNGSTNRFPSYLGSDRDYLQDCYSEDLSDCETHCPPGGYQQSPPGQTHITIYCNDGTEFVPQEPWQAPSIQSGYNGAEYNNDNDSDSDNSNFSRHTSRVPSRRLIRSAEMHHAWDQASPSFTDSCIRSHRLLQRLFDQRRQARIPKQNFKIPTQRFLRALPVKLVSHMFPTIVSPSFRAIPVKSVTAWSWAKRRRTRAERFENLNVFEDRRTGDLAPRRPSELLDPRPRRLPERPTVRSPGSEGRLSIRTAPDIRIPGAILAGPSQDYVAPESAFLRPTTPSNEGNTRLSTHFPLQQLPPNSAAQQQSRITSGPTLTVQSRRGSISQTYAPGSPTQMAISRAIEPGVSPRLETQLTGTSSRRRLSTASRSSHGSERWRSQRTQDREGSMLGDDIPLSTPPGGERSSFGQSLERENQQFGHQLQDLAGIGGRGGRSRSPNADSLGSELAGFHVTSDRRPSDTTPLGIIRDQHYSSPQFAPVARPSSRSIRSRASSSLSNARIQNEAERRRSIIQEVLAGQDPLDVSPTQRRRESAGSSTRLSHHRSNLTTRISDTPQEAERRRNIVQSALADEAKYQENKGRRLGS